MADYTSISIIYNPNSTGPGKALAKELLAELRRLSPNTPAKLQATKHAGHGEELAYKLAKATTHPLILSASGDGGYSDVVNGLVRAQAEGAHPTAGLLPAGNANDHYNFLHSGNLAQSIQRQHAQHIDLLTLTAHAGGKPFKRYAHSYIGLGLTPGVGVELNKVDLNWFKEKWVVVKGLFRSRPVHIVVRGRRRHYESLVCSNVGKMSKFLVLSKTAAINDGKFEVTVVRGRGKLRLILSLIKSTTGNSPEPLQTTRYHFRTLRRTLVQIDGEIFTLDTHTTATVAIQPRLLRCIV